MSDIPVDEIKRQKKLALFYEEDSRNKFNELAAQGKIPHLRNQNLENLDLRGYNLANMDLSGSYMRGANLSGQDLRDANFSGTSLKDAKVSGCYFPKDLPADEIRLSLEYGTRVRHR
jgi:uncharacterized protein YjbI with pentapeptide repeats